MKKKHLILPVAMTAALLLSACGMGGGEEGAQPSDGEMVAVSKTDLEELTQKAEYEDEALYYREFVKGLTSNFSSREMEKFIEKEWNYSIDVNGVNFPKDGELEIAADELTITVSEKRVPFSVIPEEESLKGKTQEMLPYLVSIDGLTPSEVANDEREHTVLYEINEVKPGDKFELHLRDEMKKRTGIQTNLATITIKEGGKKKEEAEKEEDEEEVE